MATLTTSQILGVNIISIIISALIVRCIYALFDWVKVMSEEIFDENNRDDYRRTKYYFLSTVIIIAICSLIAICILEYYFNIYLA